MAFSVHVDAIVRREEQMLIMKRATGVLMDKQGSRTTRRRQLSPDERTLSRQKRKTVFPRW